MIHTLHPKPLNPKLRSTLPTSSIEVVIGLVQGLEIGLTNKALEPPGMVGVYSKPNPIP